MVNFRLKVAQIWDLSSEIQGFEVLGFAPAKASFDLHFLASPEGYKKILSRGNSIYLIDIENSIDLIVNFFER